MTQSVKDEDRGYHALIKRLTGDATRKHDLTIGIHEAEGSQTARGTEALTVAQLGAFHEFGLGVPRRSFIADWFDDTKAEHEEQLRKMAKAVVAGTVPSIEIALERLGNRYVGEVQRRIRQGIPPPLKPATIKRKGSSVALIDSGQLWTSLRYRVDGKPGPQSSEE